MAHCKIADKAAQKGNPIRNGKTPLKDPGDDAVFSRLIPLRLCPGIIACCDKFMFGDIEFPANI